MKIQKLSNQKGEIDFRRKLFIQQVKGKRLLDDEYDSECIKTILKNRLKKTLNQMTLLKDKGVTLSPYLEIGAERCQRSLGMVNDLQMKGIAADISYHMLKSCDFYKIELNKIEVPLRICCDANSLPFLSNSIPFVFCYETLHHFPEPTPITSEIYRVLSPGGCFFFDEEPFKKVVHINLYNGHKIYSQQALKLSKYKKLIDHFCCKRVCNETEHSIIENENISLGMWKHALSLFEEKDIKLSTPLFQNVNLFKPGSLIKYCVAYMLGGGISGFCRKAGTNKCRIISLFDLLVCPSCRETGNENLLKSEKSMLSCSGCHKVYPIINDVLFLFSYDKFKELYPEVFFNLNRSYLD